MAIIEIEQLSKTYFPTGDAKGVPALKQIDLTITRGDFLAVMGPSGSGKSTLLHILGCLDTATQGTYRLGGEDTARMGDDALSAYRGQQIGFIFQAYHLIPQLTVEENISVPLFYQGHGEKTCRQRARQMAKRVGLGHRLGHTSAELSGGQQQRVAVARALAGDPLLILADEPTGNLDTRTGDEIMEMLVALNREGKTLVVVTHDKEVAARAHRVIHMRDGRIITDRPVDAAFEAE